MNLKKSRIYHFSFISLLLTGVIIGLILWLTPIGTIASYYFLRTYPQYKKQEIKSQHLNSEVSVYFDENGIPHVEAKNVLDLSFTMGFIHGRDRFFQMDLLRRVAQGRLSELFGEQPFMSNSTTVDFDLSMRGWRMGEIAKESIASADGENQKILSNYAEGVNFALKLYSPFEYQLLNIPPESWKKEDALAIALLQSWSITHNWEQEMVRFLLALNQGTDFSEKVYPSIPISSTTIDSTKTILPELPIAITHELKQVINNFIPVKNKKSSFTSDIIEVKPGASNSWVVSGHLTSTGRPMLSNDMHLSHTLPSLLYLQHIKTPDLDAIGVTLPGLPFIVAGHNSDLAWGSTSAVADVVDLVVEKINPNNTSQVLSKNQNCFLESTIEKILIRQKDKSLTEKNFPMRKTCHGSIVNDMYPDLLPQNAPLISVQWQLKAVEKSLFKLYQSNKAKTIEDFRQHLMEIPSPIQHIVIASTQGDIAFFPTGSVPRRTHQSGTFPRPGWIKDYHWRGGLSSSEMPFVKNPSSGILANGNNLPISPYAHKPFYQIDAAPGYRHDRIVELLKSKKILELKDVTNVQLDNFSKRAQLVLPAILEDLALHESPIIREKLLPLLKKWDFFTDSDSIETTLFFEIYRQSIIMALENSVDSSTLRFFLKQRYSTNVVDLWFSDQNHVVWDNPQTTTIKENRKDIIHKAATSGLNNLKKKFGEDWNNYQWGQLHYVHAQHPFSKKSKLLEFMDLEKTPLAGEIDSVWKAHFNLTDDQPFKVVAGPAVRLSMDVGNWDNCYFVTDTGNSGWPLSPHYGDLFNKWKKGELVSMYYDWKKIRANFSDRKITLSPIE